MNIEGILIQGLMLGGLYALLATGLSLVFGVMRLVNLSHGDFVVLSAYLALLIIQGTAVPLWLAFACVLPIMMVLGYMLQRGVFNHLLEGDPMRPLLATFGLSIIIQNVLMLGFTADTQLLPGGDLAFRAMDIAGVSIGVLPLITLSVAIAVIAGLNGLAVSTRASGVICALPPMTPAVLDAFGVSHRHMFAIASALAFATMCIAGVLLAVRSNFDPFIGPGRLLIAFEIVIIGGLGSFWGMLWGGILLGLAQVIGAAIDPGLQFLAGHIAFFVMLMTPAQGAFPQGGPSMRHHLDIILPIAALIALFALAQTLPIAQLRQLTEFLIFLALALNWNLLAGYAGLISVGQQAYVGIGAYTLYVGTALMGWPILASLGLSALVTAIFSLLVFPILFSPARAAIRHRVLGAGRDVFAGRCQYRKAWRGHRDRPANPDRTRHGRRPRG